MRTLYKEKGPRFPVSDARWPTGDQLLDLWQAHNPVGSPNEKYNAH